MTDLIVGFIWGAATFFLVSSAIGNVQAWHDKRQAKKRAERAKIKLLPDLINNLNVAVMRRFCDIEDRLTALESKKAGKGKL